jgi:hypothetical protein
LADWRVPYAPPTARFSELEAELDDERRQRLEAKDALDASRALVGKMVREGGS